MRFTRFMRATRTVALSTLKVGVIAAGAALLVVINGDVRVLRAQGYSLTGAIAKSITLTAASYAPSTHVDYLSSTLTLTPSTTVTAANGVNAIRGEVNLSSGKTLGNGTPSFLTGVYGRGNIFGTVNIASGDLAGLYGKFDLNGSTLTSGHIAPVQANIVNPPATAAAAGVSLLYAESASGTKIGSILNGISAANYAFDLSDVNTSNFLPAISSTTLNGLNIKVNLNGTTYYIKTGTAP